MKVQVNTVGRRVRPETPGATTKKQHCSPILTPPAPCPKKRCRSGHSNRAAVVERVLAATGLQQGGVVFGRPGF